MLKPAETLDKIILDKPKVLLYTCINSKAKKALFNNKKREG